MQNIKKWLKIYNQLKIFGGKENRVKNKIGKIKWNGLL